MKLSGDYVSILCLNNVWVSYLPDTAWQFTSSSPLISMGQHAQGGVASYGQGRAIMRDDAAIFTAQIARKGDQSFEVEMNSTHAPANYILLLNLLEGLTQDLLRIERVQMLTFAPWEGQWRLMWVKKESELR